MSAGSEKEVQQKEVKLMELQEFYETQLLQHKVTHVNHHHLFIFLFYLHFVGLTPIVCVTVVEIV